MTTMVLTVIGDDRAGLVGALAEAIASVGGNWDESHMSELAGKFAGIVQVTVPDSKTDALRAALVPLESQGLLDITVTAGENAVDGAAAVSEGGSRFELELVGHDQPGIVREMSSVLGDLGVSIEELTTETGEAPMAGGTLFTARAQLIAPAGVSSGQLRDRLEELSNQLMVDIELSENWAT